MTERTYLLSYREHLLFLVLVVVHLSTVGQLLVPRLEHKEGQRGHEKSLVFIHIYSHCSVDIHLAACVSAAHVPVSWLIKNVVCVKKAERGRIENQSYSITVLPLIRKQTYCSDILSLYSQHNLHALFTLELFVVCSKERFTQKVSLVLCFSLKHTVRICLTLWLFITFLVVEPACWYHNNIHSFTCWQTDQRGLPTHPTHRPWSDTLTLPHKPTDLV